MDVLRVKKALDQAADAADRHDKNGLAVALAEAGAACDVPGDGDKMMATLVDQVARLTERVRALEAKPASVAPTP